MVLKKIKKLRGIFDRQIGGAAEQGISKGKLTIKNNGAEILSFLSRLPAGLMREALSFAKRNSLGIIKYDKENINNVCPRCLKAHLMKKAEEKDLDKAVVEVLVNLGEYEMGHNGYYMDKEKVIKI